MTGSGKTHTILGSKSDPGLLYNCVIYFLENNCSVKYSIKELYKNKIIERKINSESNQYLNESDKHFTFINSKIEIDKLID